MVPKERVCLWNIGWLRQESYKRASTPLREQLQMPKLQSYCKVKFPFPYTPHLSHQACHKFHHH